MIRSKIAACSNTDFFNYADDLFFNAGVIFIAYEECGTNYAGIKFTPQYNTIGRSYFYVSFGKDYNYD
jgi:hypothetical protein